MDIDARKTNEQLLEELETARKRIIHLEQTVSDAQYIVISLAPSGEIVFANAYLLKLTGWKLQEVVGRNWFETFVPESERGLVREVFANLMHQAHDQKYANFENDILNRSGERLTVAWSNVLVTHPRGCAVEISCLGIDVTERRRAEYGLQQSHATLLAVLETLPAHVYVADMESKTILYLNKAMRDAFGQDCLGKHCFAVFRGIAEPCSNCTNALLLDEHGNPGGLHVWEGKNPVTKRWYLNYDQAVRWVDGRLAHIQTASDITERKLAEQALKESEEKHRLLFETMAQGVIYQAIDGAIVAANPAAERILGLSSEEMHGRTPMDPRWRMIEEDGKEVPSTDHPAMIALETGVTVGPVVRGVFHPGKNAHIWLSITAIPQFHPGEEAPFQVYATFEDITQSKEALETLRETEQRLRLANKATNDVIWDWDIVRDLQQWNEEGIHTFGWTEIVEHPVGAHWWIERIHPDDRQRVRDAFFAVVNDPHLDAWSDEYRFRKVDGAYASVLDRGYVLRDTDGLAVRMIGAMQDISERKRTEMVLQESEERFRSLFDTVPAVAVQGYGADGNTIFWNKASESFYGYTSDEAIGNNLLDLIIPAPMIPTVAKDIQRMSQTGMSIPPGELELKRKDGSHINVYSSHVILQRHNRSPELFCIDVDLTSLKQTETALTHAKEQAEAANRAKSEFLANMSHEIRTPLNGIMGMLQLIKATPLDGEQLEFADSSLRSCQRLTKLLTDILDLSRIEARKMLIAAEPLSLRVIIKELSDLFHPICKESGVILDCRISPDIPDQLTGDATRVLQVLTNLVGNALKFTKTGSVKLETYPLPPRRTGEYRVLFCVEDTGIGIPDEKLACLFKPFSQVSEGLKRQYQGAGLGLSICKELIELMGGDIVMESETGVGTTVYFCITFGCQ